MKRFICLLAVLSLLVVIPFSAFASPDIGTIVSQINEVGNGFSADGDYFRATYDYETKSVIVDIAIDGMLESTMILIRADDVNDGWYLPHNDMVMVYEVLNLFLRYNNAENINLVLRIVNDDAYIRQDYSTIVYNPLMVIKNGEIVFDMVEEMRIN